MTLLKPTGALRLVLALLLGLAAAPVVAAQENPPSPEDVLGYGLGEHFTPYAGVQTYSRALADASPRVEYRPYGMTPERRELFQLVIASPENFQRLDAILAANAELVRPETTAERATQIAATNPAVVYLSYGVHGNESSSSEAAMWTAWDLARGADEVAGVLDSLIVIIDPVVNPDGRDRYVQWFRSVVGEEPNPNPQTREHQEPWPGGRYNHYLFDLNRDWAWGTQPETRARLATWDRWNPQVHVDFHEMGYNSTYFFFPAATPINPIYPEYILEWGQRFGEANARAFDAHGWPYFTAESYDLFYPGYGDSWPSLMGAIGMTYEQAGSGSGGLAVEREWGDTLTLRERATHHRTSGQATLRTAAVGKSALLLDFAAGQRQVGRGEADVLLVPERDGEAVRALVSHLVAQGIDVERAEQQFRTDARPYPGFEERRQFPAGTYRVRARQPRGRLATTLLKPETELRAEFSYDISAWSLPYAYGVEAHQVQGTPSAGWVSAGSAEGDVANRAAPPAGYGYLLLPGPESTVGIVRFLEEGGRARVLSEAATLGERTWPVGTWFLPAFANDSLQARVAEAGLGGLAVPVASGMSAEGIDLGSDEAVPVRLPRVAVLSGERISPTSYGAHWFFLEKRLGLDFDALLVSDLTDAELSEYDVIVIPDAFGSVLNEAARERLGEWVSEGGRLVAVAGGAQSAAPIAEVEMRSESEDETASEEDLAGLLRGREQRERERWEDEVPGAIVPLRLDPAHPLAWGAGVGNNSNRLFVLHVGERVWEPAPGLESVAYFPDDLPAISGVISDPNLEQIEQGGWLVTRSMGEGSVVLFAGDPLFRLFWHSAYPLYTNALLLGP